jgi:hypothetical protein
MLLKIAQGTNLLVAPFNNGNMLNIYKNLFTKTAFLVTYCFKVHP